MSTTTTTGQAKPGWMRAELPHVAALAFLIFVSSGCRTVPPPRPADFSAPGWNVRQGQAVWKPPGGRPELAGDLLLATNSNGSFFIQLSKDPFPLVTASCAPPDWRVEFGARARVFTGRGKPPSRIGWFQLPGALRDEGVSAGWKFECKATNTWRLFNARTGETMEGVLFP